MKYLFALVCGLLLSMSNFAQDTSASEPVASGLRSEGKIYVVVAVVVTILTGVVIYLVSLDRKISKLEKQHP